MMGWLKREAEEVASATAYFFVCFFFLILLKRLLLADYGIRAGGVVTALVAALIAAKVVLVLDKAPAGPLGRLPAAVEVLARTAVYTLFALMLVWIEHAIETRAEHGGVLGAALALAERRDIFHVWSAAVAAGIAFFVYVAFAVVRRQLGGRAVASLFFTPRA